MIAWTCPRPGMLSPGPTAIGPPGPSNTAVSSNTSRTDQFAIPFALTLGFASGKVCRAATFALGSGAGLRAGLATGFASAAGVGCTIGWVLTGLAVGTD